MPRFTRPAAALGLALLRSAPAAAGAPVADPAPLLLPATPDVPDDDPLALDMARLARRYPTRLSLTQRSWSRMELARAVRDVDRVRRDADPTMGHILARVRAELAEELAILVGGRAYWSPRIDAAREVRMEGQVASGAGVSDPRPGHGGDASGSFLGLSDRADLGVGPFVATAEPRLVVDPVGGGQEGLAPPLLLTGPVGLDLRQAYARLTLAALEVTAGTQDRAWGPGRYGLVVGDNADAPLTLRVATAETFRLPWVFRYLGSFAFETAWSRLSRDRGDVEAPTEWTFLATWMPLPWVELTLERAAILGGEGRPATTARDAWQLFWGTRPHTSDDVAREEFDADELASIDARVSLPFASRIPGVQFIELYWQYAGEDVITRDFLGVPAPALAAVANLGGVHVGVGPITARFEAAVVADDRFRWYSRHRIYHEGFHHEGRVMGHPSDGDSRTWGLYLDADAGGPVAAEAWYENVERVGVLDESDGTVYTLPAREQRHRGGGSLRLNAAGRTPFQVAVRGQVESVQGQGFVPGEDHVYGALGVELRVPLSRWGRSLARSKER